MIKSIIVAAFVSGVIFVEVFMAYMLIPSTADIEKKVAEHATEGHDEHGDDPHHDEHAAALTEVDLGKFNITIHRPATDVTIRVSFHLIGTVEEEHAPEGHAAPAAGGHGGGGHGGGHGGAAAEAEPTTEAGKLLKKSEHRLRDRIIFEVRNAELADLTEPGLGLIKRRILEKSNEVLGKPMLKSILFSEFSFTQL